MTEIGKGNDKGNIDRLVRYIFGEIWAELDKDLLRGERPFKKAEAYMNGLVITERAIRPKKVSMTSEKEQCLDSLKLFERKLVSWVTRHAKKKMRAVLSEKIKVLAEHSSAKGGELTIEILLHGSETPNDRTGWDGAQFRDYFEERYALKLTTPDDVKKFGDALKSTTHRIREKEKDHRKQRNELGVEEVQHFERECYFVQSAGSTEVQAISHTVVGKVLIEAAGSDGTAACQS